MIRVTVIPRTSDNIYGLLVSKEMELRQKNQGTLHRKGEKKSGVEKWTHLTYPGWIRFQKCLGGMLVVLIQSKKEEYEWQLLSSFIGFLDRHFRGELASVTITYGDTE
jgi:hypothetical protein